MELGATLCLPRNPLCLHCPVYSMCKTRGEHVTPPRAAQLSRPAAYLLSLRKRGTVTEVLLELRADDASLMPGMYELPPLPLDAVQGREPLLRLRHAITNTNYYVQVFAAHGPEDSGLRRAVPAAKSDLHWVLTSRLGSLPLTGLARKALQRLDVMAVSLPKLPASIADMIETRSRRRDIEHLPLTYCICSEFFFATAVAGSIAAGIPRTLPLPRWTDREPFPNCISRGCCSVTITAVAGVFAGADIAVNRVRVEVDRVARFDVVRGLAMPDVERARKQIKKLAAGMLMRTRHTALLHRQKLREVGIELPVRNVIAQALEEVRRVVGAGLRQAHALVASMHAKQRLRLRFEEVAQIFGEHHGDAREIPQRRHHPPRLQLRKKAGGEPGVTAKLHQPHRFLQPQMFDAFADAFLGDK